MSDFMAWFIVFSLGWLVASHPKGGANHVYAALLLAFVCAVLEAFLDSFFSGLSGGVQ